MIAHIGVPGIKHIAAFFASSALMLQPNGVAELMFSAYDRILLVFPFRAPLETFRGVGVEYDVCVCDYLPSVAIATPTPRTFLVTIVVRDCLNHNVDVWILTLLCVLKGPTRSGIVPILNGLVHDFLNRLVPQHFSLIIDFDFKCPLVVLPIPLIPDSSPHGRQDQ